jgi:hypothetical protein
MPNDNEREARVARSLKRLDHRLVKRPSGGFAIAELSGKIVETEAWPPEMPVFPGSIIAHLSQRAARSPFRTSTNCLASLAPLPKLLIETASSRSFFAHAARRSLRSEPDCTMRICSAA